MSVPNVHDGYQPFASGGDNPEHVKFQERYFDAMRKILRSVSRNWLHFQRDIHYYFLPIIFSIINNQWCWNPKNTDLAVLATFWLVLSYI